MLNKTLCQMLPVVPQSFESMLFYILLCLRKLLEDHPNELFLWNIFNDSQSSQSSHCTTPTLSKLPPGSPGSEVQREQWDEMLEKKVGKKLHSATVPVPVRGGAPGELVGVPQVTWKIWKIWKRQAALPKDGMAADLAVTFLTFLALECFGKV